jgi:asparagine synthase (glutamine-hydrolysing)
MCAIAGLVCSKRQCREEDHLLLVKNMCNVQSHRGPDDNGVLSLGQVCLGSSRLSIIDLTKAGHMPMSDTNEGSWIVYNGEIYNFEAVRKELISYGYQFRSKTDTEVVLYAFKQWGENCLDRFVGMFAFAIYDRDTETITLVRDRFGKKPLYYMYQDGHVFFASEMKALMNVCGKPRLNQQRLMEWSLYRNVDFGSTSTLIENISSLPPGHLMTIVEGQLESPRCYYSPESQVNPSLYEHLSGQSPQSVTAEIESLIATSVQDRLVSDVPVGTLCSGGVDSSLVTALCARHLKDIVAFNVSVEGYRDLDENRYAKQVTDTLGIKLRTFSMKGEDFRRTLPRAIYHSDVPLTHPNSVAYLLISEFARQHGVTILLSGEAADELFGGYVQRYRRHRQLLLLKRFLDYLPLKIRKAIVLAGYTCDGLPNTVISECQGLLAHTIACLDKFARADLRLRCNTAYRFISNDAERAVLGSMLADLTDFLTPLLRRLDRMGMAASIECRVPFMDHRLVHIVLNLPLSFRLRRAVDKWVLKDIASHYLPRSIVYRKKTGFPLPLADYLAPLAQEKFFHNGFCVEFLDMRRQGIMEAISAWKENVHGFFNLLALEIWGRLFFLGETKEALTRQLTQGSQTT